MTPTNKDYVLFYVVASLFNSKNNTDILYTMQVDDKVPNMMLQTACKRLPLKMFR